MSMQTFKQVRQGNNITFDQLATLSQIERSVIFLMDLGVPVSRRTATTVLKALSEAAGKEYGLEDVNIPLRKTALYGIEPDLPTEKTPVIHPIL